MGANVCHVCSFVSVADESNVGSLAGNTTGEMNTEAPEEINLEFLDLFYPF